MIHRRKPRYKSGAPRDAACNKFRSAAAVARANATAGPGTQIHTHSYSRRIHPFSLPLSLCLALPQLFPLEREREREQVSYRNSIENIEIRNIKHCSTHGDQSKFYFRLTLPYQLALFYSKCSKLLNIY